ncbi:MAG: symbB, partial [Pedosphaera sp.]|nr:symbB [Pedosphaera sp.]
MMRLPINVQTANDPASLTKMRGYVDQFAGHYVIICMFGTLQSGQTGHGNGLPNGLSTMGAAWAKVNAVFSSYPNVHYEIFNEPFGYAKSDPVHYVNDMKTIISYGGLPNGKCILDGMGYADNVNLVASGGWTGDLAYHFYPSWSSDHSQSAYSNLAQAALGSWGQKTWVTEFGANLGWTSAYGYPNSCYDVYVDGNQSCSADVNCLRGLDDALRALRAGGHGVKGAFAYHGWNNGDTYDYWASWNSCGACKIREIETHD